MGIRSENRSSVRSRLGLAIGAVLSVGALVVWLTARTDDPGTSAAPDGVTSTTLRPCLLLPYVSGPVAPDGTYPVTIAQPDDPQPVVDLYLDNSSAGYSFEAVTVAPDVVVKRAKGDESWTTATSPSSQRAVDAIKSAGSGAVAITVSEGIITTIDLVHKKWDMTPRADDPCAAGDTLCASVLDARAFSCPVEPG